MIERLGAGARTVLGHPVHQFHAAPAVLVLLRVDGGKLLRGLEEVGGAVEVVGIAEVAHGVEQDGFLPGADGAEAVGGRAAHQFFHPGLAGAQVLEVDTGLLGHVVE